MSYPERLHQGGEAYQQNTSCQKKALKKKAKHGVRKEKTSRVFVDNETAGRLSQFKGKKIREKPLRPKSEEQN